METLILSALAVYGVTTIITESDGPFGLFYKLRHSKGLGAFDCFFCLSVYVAGAIALYPANNFSQWLLYTLGFSGGAIVLYKLGNY